MKDAGTSSVSHVSNNAYTLPLHSQVTLSESRFETIAMPIICSVIQCGFSFGLFDGGKSNVIF